MFEQNKISDNGRSFRTKLFQSLLLNIELILFQREFVFEDLKKKRKEMASIFSD